MELAPTLPPVASDRIGTTPAGRKKTKEDGLKNPPVSKTKRVRIVYAVGMD